VLVSIYAILKAGAAYVPIDPRNPKERIRLILEDAECSFLLTQNDVLDCLPVEQPFRKFETFGKVCIVPATSVAENTNGTSATKVAGTDDAYVIYTSGSTGTPKGVPIRHENAVNTLFAINKHLKISEKDTVFSVSSMAFDMSIPDYFLTLMCGATLILAGEETKKDGFALREALEKHRPTMMQATPTTWKILLLSGWRGDQNLKAVAGGEGFPKELAAKMVDSCKAVWNGYGPTETTIYATYQLVTHEHLATCPGEFAAIGRPIANVETVILDKNGEPVPVGVPGELFIGGKGVAAGYLKRPELTAAQFTPPAPPRGGLTSPSIFMSSIVSNVNSENGVIPPAPPRGGLTSPSIFESSIVSNVDSKNGVHPPGGGAGRVMYRTGDLVRYLPTGEIEFLGRLDNQVKIRGFRVELGEIEETMKQFPGIQQSAVNVFTDPAGSQRLVGYVVENCAPLGDDWQGRLKDFLRSKMPGYMVPTAFVKLHEMPLNTSLKIERKALPKPDLANLGVGKFEAPKTPGEKLLAGIWQDLLGLEQVSIHDDFFELGGHSLAAVSLMARIREVAGKKLPLTSLFQHPTIHKLAAQLNGFNGKHPQ
ncbi:MAG: non-ribosomal peptide synthetase, partial [Bacteroidota bacterium]